MTRLADMAKEISSKNAGNHFLTFDIVFDDSETYERVKQAGVITAERVAALYTMPVEDVVHVVEFDQGNAFKVAVRRARVSGSIGDTDVFGAQQYAPLLDFEVP
ncbi:MAG: hypothetical protein QOF29_1949 [bacterium]